MKRACNAKMTVRQWLICGMCWEVKAGVLLLLASKLLMWWGPVEMWKLSLGLFWAAVALLVGGLIHDVWLIITTKFQR